MKHYDIVIIGGGAAGIAALKSISWLYPNKTKLLIKQEEYTLIPCAIPFIYGEIGCSANNLIPNEMIKKLGADLIYKEVKNIDHRNKILQLKNHETIEYEKLILATGSLPAKPNIKGIEKDNVVFIKKNAALIDDLSAKIKISNNIVIIGGGYIGIEYAEHIKETSPQKNITVVEAADRCLKSALDKEFTDEIEAKLRYVGINIIKNVSVNEIIGEKKRADKVKLFDGKEILCDLIICGVGAVPNSHLAKTSGIDVGESGGIAVTKFMQTSASDVYACGDCIEKRSFFNHKVDNIKLASIATTEGRIVAENLYESHFENPGVIGVYSTKIHDKVFSCAGYIEEFAKSQKIGILIGESEVVNRHPASLSGAAKINTKLIFNAKSKILIGAQISGPICVGELINLCSIAIEKKMTIYELFMMQMATQPKLTASPVVYPIVSASEDALKKINH